MTDPTPTPAPITGDDLAAIMERHGLTQADIARLSGYGERMVRNHLSARSQPLDLRVSNAYRGMPLPPPIGDDKPTATA